MQLAPGEAIAGYTIESVSSARRHGRGLPGQAPPPAAARRAQTAQSRLLRRPDFSRFVREADLVAGLAHRNIVAVYDRGADDGQLWISMQYVDGVDASVALGRRRQS